MLCRFRDDSKTSHPAKIPRPSRFMCFRSASGIASTIIGATKMDQLEDNLGALEFDIPPELGRRLEEVGRPEPAFPYRFLGPAIQGLISGGTTVKTEPHWFR